MTNRLTQIIRCMAELELVERQFKKPSRDPLSVLLGQMDWLGELHDLLYSVENKG